MTVTLGETLRDEGIERVRRRQWYNHARALAIEWLEQRVGEKVTGEDITLAVVNQYGEAPTPHIWGAITRALIGEKMLVPTGERVSMTVPRSHARKTDVYLVQRMC